MRETVTVQQAISKGKWTINLPAVLLLFGLFFGSVALFSLDYFEGWILAVGGVAGFLSAWIYWSYAITKWRIWAFENVRNVHELKRKAVEANLIWREGSWAEKTEIRNYDDKQKLKQLEKKFLEKDVYRDDINVPKEVIINYSKGMIGVGFAFGLGAIGLGIYLYLENPESYVYLFGFGLGLYYLFISTKKVTSKGPLIVLNSKGIQLPKKDFMDWQYITNDYVEKRQSGKHVHHYLSLNFHGQHQEIGIDDLDTNVDELENFLHVYRVRYEKSNPS